MPLIPLQLDDDLYLKLKETAELKKIEILDYIQQRLAQPAGELLEIDGEPGEGIAIQPAVALDEEYKCGFTRSHLIDARQKLLEISMALGWPLAEILWLSRGACKDAQWLADRILKDLTWLEECLDKDASQAVEDAPPTWRSGATERIDPFWVVARDNNDGHELKATKRHPALPSAEFEAERLCARERVPFLVLQSVSRCEAGPVPVKWQLAKENQL